VSKAEGKFVIYRQLEDGYRWRLRSPTGETLAASEAGHPSKSTCQAEIDTFMADHRLVAEVLDATIRGRTL
jgi:uncharacterized protein YegP (UPF0339 family)